MKRLLVFSLAVLMAMTFVSCAKPAQEKIVLNEVTHSVFYAPQYAAIKLGFFKDEGLDIELVNGGGSDKSMTAVLSGQADIGLMGPETVVYVYNEGKSDHPIVVGQLTKRDGAFLMGREPVADFRWESLECSTIIGGRKGGMPEMTLEYVLKQHGLVPSQNVTVDTSVQFNLMGGAFEGGQGDYVTLFEPTASMFEQEGKGHILAAVGEASGEVPYTAYVVSKNFLEKRPQTIQKFINAIARAQAWIRTASDEAVADAIIDFFPDTSKETLTAVAKRYREIDAWMLTPVMQPEAFERMQAIMSEAGELEKKAPFEALINNTFAEKAIK